MASLAHLVVGAAGGRVLPGANPARRMMGLAALGLLADVDVIAFALHIPYSAPFGHRGATHSIAFALAAGALASLLLPGERWKALAVACAVALSHPLLDAMTDGGLGVALLWPLSNARFFAPWRPIPVAPIGARMLSARGLHLMLVEALWSAPLLGWTLWRSRR